MLSAVLQGVATAPTTAAPTTTAPPSGGHLTGAPHQHDGGTHGDAGDTFDAATPIAPKGHYSGILHRGAQDVDDYFKFPVAAGGSMSVLVTIKGPASEPVELLDPTGTPVEVGTTVAGQGASASTAVTTETASVRLTVQHALTGGDYRLHITGKHLTAPKTAYALCFMNCDDPVDDPIEFIFGGSLATADASVLLIPPSHGDLGNPEGPTVTDYIDATLRGMRRWETVLDRFAAEYPQFGYLKDISVDIEVFDELDPVEPLGYDVVIGYVAAGPAFRGVATSTVFGNVLSGDTRFSGRTIALSLFGSSPRAGQTLYDFPEVSDLESVTMHEFAHTFGLGHTRTWHAELGADLMNSPAPFVYGDGATAGDGGERTPLECFSSLDLYGMAVLYRWLPTGTPVPTWGEVSLPPTIPYKLYC